MAARKGPTYLRIMLGKELQALREAKKREAEQGEYDDPGEGNEVPGVRFTAEAVSLALGFSRSKLSRVEAGEIPLPKLADLEALMDHYSVSDPDNRADLLQIQRDSLKTDPITTYRNVLPSGMPRYLGLERDSVAIQGYEKGAVHGLLQHEDYARAQMGSAKVVEERTTAAVESGVQARMERKTLLEASERAVHIILTESTLRTLVGTPETMRTQYAEIIRLCGQDNVEVQVIPDGMPDIYRAGFNFTVLRFEELDPVVQSDGHRSTTMWSKPSDVSQFDRQFQEMAKAAPGPTQTPRFLHDLEKKLWT